MQREKEQKAAEVRQQKLAAQRERREKALAEARRMEQEAEQAQQDAARARQQLAKAVRAAASVNSAVPAGGTNGAGTGRGSGSGGSAGSAIIKKHYAAKLNGTISSHWKLPETVTTNRSLKTLVALTLRRDGSIAAMKIEQKSGDAFFDQSVMKALRSAEAQLPEFPALISESSLEFALNFTPQGLKL